MATRKGMIKRTPYSEFANLRKTGLIAIVAARGRRAGRRGPDRRQHET